MTWMDSHHWRPLLRTSQMLCLLTCRAFGCVCERERERERERVRERNRELDFFALCVLYSNHCALTWLCCVCVYVYVFLYLYMCVCVCVSVCVCIRMRLPLWTLIVQPFC